MNRSGRKYELLTAMYQLGSFLVRELAYKSL